MTDGIALDVVPDFEYTQNTAILDPGDTLILYTDGVTEAINDEEEEFGLDRLCDLFAGAAPGTPEEVNAAIFDAVNVFANNTPQSDDITCLALRRSET